MVHSPFSEDVIQRRQIYLALSSSFFCSRIVFCRGLCNWTTFPPRHINSSGLLCFTGADTGKGNKAAAKKSEGLIAGHRCVLCALSQVRHSQNTLDFLTPDGLWPFCLSHRGREAFRNCCRDRVVSQPVAKHKTGKWFLQLCFLQKGKILQCV